MGDTDELSAEEKARFVLDSWDRGTFYSIARTIMYHLDRHGRGRSAYQYTNDAITAWEMEKQNARLVYWGGRVVYRVRSGYYTLEGKILTFWNG